MGRSQMRGFSLVELVVALAVVIVLAWSLFHVLSQTLLTARMQSADDLEQSTIGQLIDTLTTEEDDAWAIYTPPADVLGRSNADGHEVDFFARDGRQRPYFWAYSYDASAGTLTRYRFAAPGGAATVDTAFTGITKFHAQTYPVTALQDSNTPIYSALYNGASLQSGTVHFYSGMPWIAGGNNITYVHIESAAMRQDLQLATQTAPSGFTVVVYYTPSPAPQPTPTPNVFKTWPANLALATSGTTFPTTPGTLADNSPERLMAQTLNTLLGGGIANAASTPCYAYAYGSGSSPDTSLGATPEITIPGFPGGTATIGVASDGCEIFSTDGGATWTPVGTPNSTVPEPVMIAYEPNGTTGTFSIYGGTSSCQTNGNLTIGNWYPNLGANDVKAALEAASAAAGTCSITFTDGQSTQTPTADNGLVDVSVQSGCGFVGGSCTFTSVPWPNDSPNCTPPNNGSPGGWTAGYNGTGFYTLQGIAFPIGPANAVTSDAYGSIATNADGSVTFTRTASGADSITAYGEYVGYEYINTGGVFECRKLPQYNVLATWPV